MFAHIALLFFVSSFICCFYAQLPSYAHLINFFFNVVCVLFSQVSSLSTLTQLLCKLCLPHTPRLPLPLLRRQQVQNEVQQQQEKKKRKKKKMRRGKRRRTVGNGGGERRITSTQRTTITIVVTITRIIHQLLFYVRVNGKQGEGAEIEQKSYNLKNN